MRDAAGTGPHIPQGVRLFRLHELKDWSVADGEPDIRGWEVRTVSGRLIGKITDLCVDPSRGEVVLLDIDLDGTDRHTLAPIRAAQIDRANKVVRIDSGDVPYAAIPSLARTGSTDTDRRTFGDEYSRTYGDRGGAKDRDFVVGHGERDLQFSEREVRIEAASEEGQKINQELAGLNHVRYPGRGD